MPDWDKLAAEFEGNDGVAIVDVDCTKDDNMDLCNEEQKANIEKFQAMDTADLQAAVDAKTDAQAAAEKYFKDELAKLQARYEELSKEKDAKVAEASTDLSTMRVVLAAASKGAGKDE